MYTAKLLTMLAVTADISTSIKVYLEAMNDVTLLGRDIDDKGHCHKKVKVWY